MHTTHTATVAHQAACYPEPTTKWCPLCALVRPAYEAVCRRCHGRLLDLGALPPPVVPMPPGPRKGLYPC